ncbi:diguanylate cyclase [Cupriavidus pauculus]|uniref:GGDEF domain-containing protein n=1 Tax=Cupriavidus pauculus TaxID=82633 RepID=UPI00385753B7
MATPRTDLRTLILALALGACVITLANSLYSSYRVMRETLIQNALDANHAYSARVAASVNAFLLSAQSRLQYAAGKLSDRFTDIPALASEARRLQLEDDAFDSVLIVDSSGRILAGAPDSLRLDGMQLSTPSAQAALQERKPRVSPAFRSGSGNLIVFISAPIITRAGEFLGYIGGAIYVEKDGILHSLITKHFYLTDAQVYLVDSQRTLLFHTVSTRIGLKAGENKGIDNAFEGQDGSSRMTTGRGNDVLSGYAFIPAARWAVVSQQPVASVLAPLHVLMSRILKTATPIAVVGFLVIWGLAVLIARPLRRLAESTTDTGLIESADKIAHVRAWYFESNNIKQALLRSINSTQARVTGLELASQTDPLTGLANRRALDEALTDIQQKRMPVALVALDIDHFKRVNDTFGHDVGDLVLQHLARCIRDCSRSHDLPCRVGGEEFLVLLPDTSLSAAMDYAERLRKTVEGSAMPQVGRITISIGVTTWPRADQSLADAIKEADERMYEAKRGGRNRVVASLGEGKLERQELRL